MWLISPDLIGKSYDFDIFTHQEVKSDCYLQPPQFVDILLAEEDSSDEEYRPDEEDEDETAEDVRLV